SSFSNRPRHRELRLTDGVRWPDYAVDVALLETWGEATCPPDVNSSVKRAPPPMFSDTVTSPPCAFMVSLTMARPNPAPSALGPLPRQNRSKIRSRSTNGTPAP